jgi:hypothetical protein
MLCEKTNFSHAYIRIHSESLDCDLIYQATGAGVNFVGTEVFDSHHQVVEEYEIKVDDETRKKLLRWAVANSGKPYGKLQILGLGIRRLVRFFGWKIRNPFKNGNIAYVCCELVAAALGELGKPIQENLDDVDLLDLRKHVVNVYTMQSSNLL